MTTTEQAAEKRRAVTNEWLARLSDITDPLAVAVLNLHRCGEGNWGWNRCQGCDMDGYEAEEPEWPCRTVELVAAHFGHPAPRWVELTPVR